MGETWDAGMKEKIRESILKGHSGETEELVLRAAACGAPPEAILREVMVPAMKEAGEISRMNEMDIPRLLSAARSMQRGLNALEPWLRIDSVRCPCKVILGTVEGDLHEVGKNLVAVMLRCEGFEVIDLGVDVSVRQFLRAVRANPDTRIVCISSLLTTSLQEMRRVVQAVRREDPEHRILIMVGGGSVTERLAREMGADVYTEDAVTAAGTAARLVRERADGAGGKS